MKTQKEIEQLVYSCFGEKEWTNVSTNAKLSLIQTYTQCQEDMIKEIDNLKGQLRTYEAKEPKYAVEGDYCSVCGCTEFWNDEEE